MKNVHILLVDDDQDNCVLFVHVVRRIAGNFKCQCAKNGKEALEALQDPRQEVPDIIFLDLNMPGLNGKECLKKFRVLDKVKDLPIIVYTTSTDERDKSDVMALGATEFLRKHLSLEEMEVDIAALIKKHVLQEQRTNSSQ